MPQIVNSRTMVPMRGLFEYLGATVEYDEITRLITAKKGTDTVSLAPENDIATVNGEKVVLESPPFITEKGRTMVPLRFVAEALDIRVGWDSNTKTVYVLDK